MHPAMAYRRTSARNGLLMVLSFWVLLLAFIGVAEVDRTLVQEVTVALHPNESHHMIGQALESLSVGAKREAAVPIHVDGAQRPSRSRVEISTKGKAPFSMLVRRYGIEISISHPSFKRLDGAMAGCTGNRKCSIADGPLHLGKAELLSIIPTLDNGTMGLSVHARLRQFSSPTMSVQSMRMAANINVGKPSSVEACSQLTGQCERLSPPWTPDASSMNQVSFIRYHLVEGVAVDFDMPQAARGLLGRT